MNQTIPTKLFISYSHADESKIDEFRKHLAPLENNGTIEYWYDRKILGGQELYDKIDEKLESAEIVCLMLSANYLASKACLDEKNSAFALKKNGRVVVVPVILSQCGWRDDEGIAQLLACPTDGKPISEFSDTNAAWQVVYQNLKAVIEEYNKVRHLKIKDQFLLFINSVDLLSKAHSQKNEVFLDDIFVYPELLKYDYLQDIEKKESSRQLIENLLEYSKILIAGENQSGKTTLCKKLFIELRNKNFVPIYISGNINTYKGKIENILATEYNNQYEGVNFDEIDKKRIVPILDDFHFARHREKHIQELSLYKYQIVIVDDVFSLNFKNEALIKSFTRFRIKEYSPSLRNELIKKWVTLTDTKKVGGSNHSDLYENIDSITELVDSALGKIFGSGIMPSYPFFILSVITTYETFEKPLDQEITSQGYCYQALIYLYLRKQGVKNDEMDTYVNFLMEFAFFIFENKKNEISNTEFDSFMASYLEKYNFPIKQDILLDKLQLTNILTLDKFNNYSFCYKYLYYFFVGKYLAEHIESNGKHIDIIINNLHKDENAYIAIFISHHSRNSYILDEILVNAYCLFDRYKPATLSEREMVFFDQQSNVIAKAVLPLAKSTPEKVRAERLKEQDSIEEIEQKKLRGEPEDANDELAKELRRSVKTVEVMGLIIKNRAGSLEKSKLIAIFEAAMEVHLRILSSFFEFISDNKMQQGLVDYFSARLSVIVDERMKEQVKVGKKERKPTYEELIKISKQLFWNLNFFIVYGFIDKIVHSLGSNKLLSIIEIVCDKNNTPASFLIKHGILMWYNKNLQIDDIATRLKGDGFSKTAENIMKFMIVNHCVLHPLGYKEYQRIQQKLGISSEKLLLQKAKKIEHDK